ARPRSAARSRCAPSPGAAPPWRSSSVRSRHVQGQTPAMARSDRCPGARTRPRRIIRHAMATDHMPLEGWDHLELWVGNAKPAAYWYEHALGFDVVAYAGPETGVRDRASYVMRQGEIRFALTSALRETSEITEHVTRHGD